MVGDHHYGVPATLPVKNVARDGARVREEPGLNVRVAGDTIAFEALLHGAVGGDHRQGRDQLRHHGASPSGEEQRPKMLGADPLQARKARAGLEHEFRRRLEVLPTGPGTPVNS